jgi:RNA 2',3'-cyclic 3'-phosphodiesterase
MVRAPHARLFVAVDLPAAVREELAAWARGAGGVLTRDRATGHAPPLRLLDSEALHVTVCFLGSRPVAEIDAIAAVLRSCATPAGEACLGAPLWLPPRRPRALAVEVRDRDGQLARLHGALREALARAIGWEAERRRFRAHVTVARLRGGRRVRGRDAGPGAQPLPATPQLSFMAESAVLYRSWLSRAGATYEPLAECSLLEPAG